MKEEVTASISPIRLAPLYPEQGYDH